MVGRRATKSWRSMASTCGRAEHHSSSRSIRRAPYPLPASSLPPSHRPSHRPDPPPHLNTLPPHLTTLPPWAHTRVRAAAVATAPRRDRRAARAARHNGGGAPLLAAGAGIATEAVTVEGIERVEGAQRGVAVEGVAVYAHVGVGGVGVRVAGAAPLSRQAAAGRLRRESHGAARATRFPIERALPDGRGLRRR